jgi:hypothetical protein
LEPPLGVTFTVRPDERSVFVLWVWHFPMRKNS